ncbi:MAG: DUF1015 domain-containing protein [Oscillospiraceae bacterium]|jgi:uncharacterized protein (DUF1015 family)
MAVIRPFRAVRPYKSFAADVASLPYDVFTREEARRYTASRPLSFLNIDRPETQFPEGYDMYAPEVYKKADEMLKSRLRNRIFVRDPGRYFYIYELTMDGRSQTGLVGLSSVDDYESGVCRRHENTVREKEQDRINHIDATSAQTGPIFLTYRPVSSIRDCLENEKKSRPPEYDFTAENGVVNRVWVVDSPGSIAFLEKEFGSVPRTYIADGHHRAASAVRVAEKRRMEHPGYTGDEEFNFFLSVLFPSDELMIMDYNRVVTDMSGCSGDFMDLLSRVYSISGPTGMQKPGHKGQVSMYMSGEWRTLETRPEIVRKHSSSPVSSLDVSVLQDEVLGPVLGINDLRSDPRISFVGGVRGLDELMSRTDTADPRREGKAAAFAMYPTDIDELLDVADAGMLMPPKSTWFEPKLMSGLFIHEIER